MPIATIKKIMEDGRLYTENFGYLIRDEGHFQSVVVEDVIIFFQDGAKIREVKE